jgi:hypothetical protein
MIVQVTRLPLQQKLLEIGHNLLYCAWTDRSCTYCLYIY